MAEINEAYRVLGDPGRRAVYDRSLSAPSPGAAEADLDEADADDEPRHARPRRVLAPEGPARYP